MTMHHLKLALFSLYFCGAYHSMEARALSLGFGASLFLYIAMLGLVVLCTVFAGYVENRWLRYAYALLLASSTFLVDSAERIIGDSLTYDGFVKLVDAAGFAGDAWAQHGHAITVSILYASCLFAGVAIRPTWRPPVPRLGLMVAPAACAALLAAVFFVRGGEGSRGLPNAFTSLAYAAIYQYEVMLGTSTPRQAVKFPRPQKPGRDDIVLIIDESIAANYLDINHPRGVRSGLAEPRAGIEVHNYGRAAAITNCSAGSNLTLRYGGTRGGYRRINATMPSLWDYAHYAGFRTVYIDAQRTGGELHNLMTEEERARIDRFVQMDGVPVRDRDIHAAELLAQMLGNGVPEVVLVNKVGGHFPVNDKFPDAYARYHPILPRGGFEDISDDGNKPRFRGTDEDWQRYRNSYRNTLLWNVGGFFDRLFQRADLSAATLIYTSDHGQDLHEVRRAGLNTHCSDRPQVEEAVVPLVVIESAERRKFGWHTNLAGNRDQSSHYQIFPTLLALMGYDARYVQEAYGSSLIVPSNDPFTFNKLFYARLGREPVWQRIDLHQVSVPPAD